MLVFCYLLFKKRKDDYNVNNDITKEAVTSQIKPCYEDVKYITYDTSKKYKMDDYLYRNKYNNQCKVKVKIVE